MSLDNGIYQYLRGGALGATKPTLCQLRKLVNQASRDNPHSTSRLEKAAFLVLLRPIVPLGDHHYRIGAEDGLRLYEVLDGHCQCSDYLRHGAGHPCSTGWHWRCIKGWIAPVHPSVLETEGQHRKGQQR